MRWFLFSVLTFSFFFFSSPVFAQSSSNSTLSCTSSTTSFSIEGILCALGDIIDQFTEFTPNILSSSSYGGSLAGIAYNQYVNGTEYAAEILIPIIIFIYIAHIIGESSFGTFHMSPIELLKDILFAFIALILSVYVLSLMINFINVLDKFIVVNIVGSSNGNLFSTIINDLGGVNFSNGFFFRYCKYSVINYINYCSVLIYLSVYCAVSVFMDFNIALPFFNNIFYLSSIQRSFIF